MYCLVVTDDFSRFSWVFFVVTKDETSEILKTFIADIENLIDLRVKEIRCDNRTEFKNRVMNQFCEMKGIKKEFSVARTPQQNGVAKRKNRTLIEAAKTMLLSSFMRPFGCPITILNTIDHLGKFDGKDDEGFFVGYSTNSKAFRVVNSRTRIVEENMHVKFSDNTPNIARSGPNWLFDIDALTKSMNYKPMIEGNQSNGSTGTQACDCVGKDRMEIIPDKDYILLPLWTQDPLLSSSSKDSLGDGFNPSKEEEKKYAEDPGNENSKVPCTEEPRVNQEKGANVNSTNNVNTVSPTDNAAGIKDNIVNENIVYGCVDDPNIPDLEEISRFGDAKDDDSGDDMNNLDTYFKFSLVPTTRIHKDHLLNQVIGDLQSTTQTRQMTKNLEKCGFEPKKVVQALKDPSWIEAMQEELLQFKLQEVWTLVELPNRKRAIGTKWFFRNKMDERGIVIKNKARLVTQGYTQEEEINYDEVSAHVAKIKRIRLFLTYASFKDFVVYQMDVKSDFLYGKIEEEVYVCQPPGFEDPDFPDREMCNEFEKMMHKKFHMSYMGELTFFLGMHVKQKEDGIFINQDKYVNEILNKFSFSDVKTASTPMETHKTLLKNEKRQDVDEHLYRSMIRSLMYLTSSRPDIMFIVCACSRFQVNPKISHLHAMKRIFRYLKGESKLGLWYLNYSPFDLVAYTDSDYAGASLDRKSTTGGCQFLRCRLISWKYKKQTVVANSTIEAEYVAASSYCGKVLWIQNQLLDYGYNFMHTKIYIDNESTICIVKNPIFHSKTNHIEIRHHFIIDSNEKKLIQMIKIHTDKNGANFLTKAFDVSRFQYLIASIGMLIL
nr:hypothetical protein [Tanacetum cinerariifolium]